MSNNEIPKNLKSKIEYNRRKQLADMAKVGLLIGGVTASMLSLWSGAEAAAEHEQAAEECVEVIKGAPADIIPKVNGGYMIPGGPIGDVVQWCLRHPDDPEGYSGDYIRSSK